MPEIKVDESLQHFDDLIASVTYINYRFNRDNDPSITPEQWKVVYGDKVNEMEMLYQLERKRDE